MNPRRPARTRQRRPVDRRAIDPRRGDRSKIGRAIASASSLASPNNSPAGDSPREKRPSAAAISSRSRPTIASRDCMARRPLCSVQATSDERRIGWQLAGLRWRGRRPSAAAARDRAPKRREAVRPRPPAAAARGYSSITTWALTPPKPNELTPARRGSSASHGRWRSTMKNGLPSRLDVRIQPLEVQHRRKGAVLHREHHLEDSSGSRGRFEMPEIALDGSDAAPRQLRVAGAELAEGAAQCADLDRISEPRGRAVGLDVADAPHVDARFASRRRRAAAPARPRSAR